MGLFKKRCNFASCEYKAIKEFIIEVEVEEGSIETSNFKRFNFCSYEHLKAWRFTKGRALGL